MMCSKCGTENNNGEKICKVCAGELGSSTENVQNNYSQLNNQSQYNNVEIIDNDELVKSYIGKNADKIINMKGGSIWVFLFGPWYLIYRKMYLLGIVWLAIDMFIKLSVIINIVLAFLFKYLYLNKVNKKVEQIRKENPSKNFNELKSICANKGGIDKWVAAVFIIVFAVIYLILNYDNYSPVECKSTKNGIETTIIADFRAGELTDVEGKAYYEAKTEEEAITTYEVLQSYYAKYGDLDEDIKINRNDKIVTVESNLDVSKMDKSKYKYYKKDFVDYLNTKGYTCK